MTGRASVVPPRPRRRRRGGWLLGACLAGAVGLVGCDLPGTTTETPSPTSSAPALGSEPPDPHAEALATAVAELRRTVAAARDALAEAHRGSGDDAEAAAERAVELLAADEELDDEAAPPDPRPLFPGPESSREETIDYGDAFTRTLSAARAAGPAGAAVLDVLRDPVAGDLGGWQRDAAGMLEQIDDAASPTDDVSAAEEAVVTLDGEGPRALAWALLAAGADDDELRAAYAERGTAHLDIVLAAIDDVAGTEPAATGGS